MNLSNGAQTWGDAFEGAGISAATGALGGWIAGPTRRAQLRLTFDMGYDWRNRWLVEELERENIKKIIGSASISRNFLSGLTVGLLSNNSPSESCGC